MYTCVCIKGLGSAMKTISNTGRTSNYFVTNAKVSPVYIGIIDRPTKGAEGATPAPLATQQHSELLGNAKVFFLKTRDRSSTKCPSRVHIAGHGSMTGPALGVG